MGNLHMRRQGMKSTRNKPPDIELEYKRKNVVFFTTVDPRVQQRRENLLRYMRTLPHHIRKRK